VSEANTDSTILSPQKVLSPIDTTTSALLDFDTLNDKFEGFKFDKAPASSKFIQIHHSTSRYIESFIINNLKPGSSGDSSSELSTASESSTDDDSKHSREGSKTPLPPPIPPIAIPTRPRRFRKQPAYFWNNIPPVMDLSDQSGSGWLFKELAIKNKALKRLGLQSDNATPRMEKWLSKHTKLVYEALNSIIIRNTLKNHSCKTRNQLQKIMIECINLPVWRRHVRRRLLDRHHRDHWKTLHALDSLVRGRSDSLYRKGRWVKKADPLPKLMIELTVEVVFDGAKQPFTEVSRHYPILFAAKSIR